MVYSVADTGLIVNKSRINSQLGVHSRGEAYEDGQLKATARGQSSKMARFEVRLIEFVANESR
jgi:hypothetical protein